MANIKKLCSYTLMKRSFNSVNIMILHLSPATKLWHTVSHPLPPPGSAPKSLFIVELCPSGPTRWIIQPVKTSVIKTLIDPSKGVISITSWKVHKKVWNMSHSTELVPKLLRNVSLHACAVNFFIWKVWLRKFLASYIT